MALNFNLWNKTFLQRDIQDWYITDIQQLQQKWNRYRKGCGLCCNNGIESGSLWYVSCRGPFCLHRLALISALIGNYIHYKKWDEITYPSRNFNGCIVEILEWISNFFPYFTWHAITYPCWDERQLLFVKRGMFTQHLHNNFNSSSPFFSNMD